MAPIMNIIRHSIFALNQISESKEGLILSGTEHKVLSQ